MQMLRRRPFFFITIPVNGYTKRGDTMKQQTMLYYGGDYNPDQWDDATIDEDMRLFRQAGINLVTLPVFSWAKLEPEEGVYNFAWLDALMDKFAQNGLRVCLATPTTAQPAWLSTRYPEVLPVDIAGRKRTHGMRVFFCVNSLKYRERATAIAREMALRYKNHPALALWHVANEYGTYCYCPHCEAKFRLWLRNRYKNIETLNDCWTTAFWGRILYRFEEVCLPTELNDDYRFNPAIQLDYMRFVTDSTIECFRGEYDIVKAICPDIPITTNMSGFIKKLNQQEFTKHLDVVGWDNYPWPTDEPSFVAFKHDIMRGLKGGAPYFVMEQSPNQQNWQAYNKLKRPGEVRLLSYQALAHGADSCLFFQLRQSRGGQEKFHGAVISHAGTSDTRVFRECAQLGGELKTLADAFVGGRSQNRAAIVIDWEAWWALELASGPSKDMDYLKTAARYYKGLYANNIPVDVIGTDADFSAYSLLITPMLYMLKPGVADKLRTFTEGGGTLVSTTMTGLADENDRCNFGAYPGPLRSVFGLWVEETDALFPDEANTMQMTQTNGLDSSYGCGFLCDVVRVESATVLARFGGDFYAQSPALTCNNCGSGTAYYIATQPDDAFLKDFFAMLCTKQTIAPVLEADSGVEITCRVAGAKSAIFVLNHNHAPAHVKTREIAYRNLLTGETVCGNAEIGARDVWVLAQSRNKAHSF